jgi:hypothetical protein
VTTGALVLPQNVGGMTETPATLSPSAHHADGGANHVVSELIPVIDLDRQVKSGSRPHTSRHDTLRTVGVTSQPLATSSIAASRRRRLAWHQQRYANGPCGCATDQP